VLTQLTGKQSHAIVEGGGERSREPSCVSDLREILQPLASEESTPRRLKDAERQIAYIESSLTTMDERLQQKLKITVRLLVQPAGNVHMKLSPAG